jgi:hypothetical protein
MTSVWRKHGEAIAGELHVQEDDLDLEASKRKVAALTAPRNVVLVGASDRAGTKAIACNTASQSRAALIHQRRDDGS